MTLESRTTVRAVGVGVGGDRLRQVRLGGLEQSSNGECVVQVVGIKASGPENPRRLDTTSGEKVAKESRDVTGISTQEALGAQVAGGLVLGGAMRGARATAPGYDQHRGRDGGGACGHTLGESSRRKGRVNLQGCPGSWSRPW